MEEDEYTQLNQEHRQLQDEYLTRVEKLRSTNEREKVLEYSNPVSKNQATNRLQP